MVLAVSRELPSYDELPVRADAPPGSSWGVFDDDRLGTLSLLDADTAVAAAELVTDGTTFGLNAPMNLPDPPLFGRSAMRHEVTSGRSGASHDDVLHGWNTQSSSQWDGFRHIGSVFGHYGGLDDEAHGVEHWAERGLVGRAVLADVARWRAAQGRPIDCAASEIVSPDDIMATLADQGTEVRTGDVLLLRFGWWDWYRSLDAGGRTDAATDLRTPGLPPGDETARFLWDLHVAAVAADNPALEVWPPGSTSPPERIEEARADPVRMPEVFAHFAILPLLGIPIGEMFDLDPFAEHCASMGRWEAMFVSAPLRLPHGVATPPNAVVIT